MGFVPEWLNEQSILVVLLAIGNIAQWHRAREKDGATVDAVLRVQEVEQSRTAEVTSMSAVTSAVQRAIRKSHDITLTDINEAKTETLDALSDIRDELRGLNMELRKRNGPQLVGNNANGEAVAPGHRDSGA